MTDLHIFAQRTTPYVYLNPGIGPVRMPGNSEPRWCAGKMVSGLAILIFFNDSFNEDIRASPTDKLRIVIKANAVLGAWIWPDQAGRHPSSQAGCPGVPCRRGWRSCKIIIKKRVSGGVPKHW